MQSVVVDHEKTIDLDNPRDLIDDFIIESKKRGSQNEAFTGNF